jgi:hypothetical protein
VPWQTERQALESPGIRFGRHDRDSDHCYLEVQRPTKKWAVFPAEQ